MAEWVDLGCESRALVVWEAAQEPAAVEMQVRGGAETKLVLARGFRCQILGS